MIGLTLEDDEDEKEYIGNAIQSQIEDWSKWIEMTHRRNCSYKFLGMKVMIVYSVGKLSRMVVWERGFVTGGADFVPLVANDRFAMGIYLYSGEGLVDIDVPALSWYHFVLCVVCRGLGLLVLRTLPKEEMFLANGLSSLGTLL